MNEHDSSIIILGLFIVFFVLFWLIIRYEKKLCLLHYKIRRIVLYVIAQTGRENRLQKFVTATNYYKS
jgi:hypothetical protein